MIKIDPKGPTFHLRASGISYVLGVFQGRLIHAYWGAALNEVRLDCMIPLGFRHYSATENIPENMARQFAESWVTPPDSLSDPGQIPLESSFSPERLPFEFPEYGWGDLRETALRCVLSDGSLLSRFSYRGYEILPGLHGPSGLPYVSEAPEECRALRIDLSDELAGLQLSCFFQLLPDLPILLRWNRLTNESGEPVVIDRIASASVDFPGSGDLVTLNGSWARERHFHRRPLAPGVQSVESRGGSSSHHHAPFLALCDSDASERYGRVRSLSLAYGGSHRHLAEWDRYGNIRLQAGINPSGFSWTLGPGHSFETPAAVLTFSDTGFTGLSDSHHEFVRRWLLPKVWRDKDRPVLINSWEAHYFDVSENKVLELARRGKEIGAEVIVLDDGWFENRSDDKRALGDWLADPAKFPEGLGETVRRVRDEGLDFGIWVEPEMISPESRLFQRHPDWAMALPNRDPVMTRSQLVLDLSKPQVVDYLLDVLSGLFSASPITYVKWDMNRTMTDPANPEIPHRYMLGLYRLWASLNKRFPHILFEGCAGGGGRFDFGSLAYMPQFWTSDQTDAVERLPIQFGSSLLFPQETMGAHVSAVPNHQVGRMTPAVTRGYASLCFNFGFELDLASESPSDLELYARFSRIYKERREFFRRGSFRRLRPAPSPTIDSRRPDSYAWAVVSKDLAQAMVFFFHPLVQADPKDDWLALPFLDSHALYRDRERDLVFDGAFLAQKGLWLPPSKGDYRVAVWDLERISSALSP